MNIICLITIYFVNANVLHKNVEQVKGVFIKQSISGTEFQVDFTESFNQMNVDKKVNIGVQWIKHNDCLYIKQENKYD